MILLLPIRFPDRPPLERKYGIREVEETISMYSDLVY